MAKNDSDTVIYKETPITLREYVDLRFITIEKSTSAALDAAQRAVTKAEISTEKRFENVNEFREALNDNSRMLLPRSEFDQVLRSLTEKIEVLTVRLNSRDDQRVGISKGWSVIVSAVGFAAVVLGIIMTILHSK